MLREFFTGAVRLLDTDVRDLLKTEGRLVNDAFLDELLKILIKADVGVASAQQTIEQVRTDFRGRVVHLEDVVGILKQKLRELLEQPEMPRR